jgi:hypothetical protein
LSLAFETFKLLLKFRDNWELLKKPFESRPLGLGPVIEVEIVQQRVNDVIAIPGPCARGRRAIVPFEPTDKLAEKTGRRGLFTKPIRM